jgi:hypothetical protein
MARRPPKSPGVTRAAAMYGLAELAELSDASAALSLSPPAQFTILLNKRCSQTRKTAAFERALP